MSADTRSPTSDADVQTYTKTFMTEPADVQRTPEEKACIPARLTLELAAIDKQEGRAHGNA